MSSEIEEIINFAFLYDDKKTPLKELEDKIIDKIQHLEDIDKIKTFYLNHLDLFVKYQNKFQNVIRNHIFLDEYMKYRTSFADIKSYIDNLTLYNTQISPSESSSPSTMISRPSTASIKSKITGIFEKKYPPLSIFSKIEPNDFSIICHKIYLCYYFLTEIREYQFYSRVSKRELNGYAHEFENFYDNFYRKMENEIEIFCEANKFSLLVETFISLSKYFLEVGNTAFSHTCISLMNRFKICKENKVQEFLDIYNLSLPLNILALTNYKKFTYLVDPGSINRAFINANEVENKIKSFSFIQSKMIKTKQEILSQNITSTKSTNNDFLVFNYINPKITIKEKLYTSSTPGGIEFLCIQDKCNPQKGGNFEDHQNFINSREIDIDNINFEYDNCDNTNIQIIYNDNDNDNYNDNDNISHKVTDKSNVQSDYIWEDLPKKWQTKLLSSNFFIKNCLGDGNCQFRSIETALINSGYKINHKKLRNIIVKYINSLDNPTFFNIIQNYRIEKDNGEFIGNWDPYTIRNKRNFTTQIKQDGFHFQGDHTTLLLLSNALNIDFIILTSDFNIINLSNPDNLNNHKLIILYYDKITNTDGHYKTIGFKIKRKIETIFKTPFPPEIINLLDKNKLLLNHLHDIINETINKSRPLQLNNILMSMQKKLHTNISSEDKNTIMLLLTFWLEDNKYFEKSSPKKSSPKKSSIKKLSPKKSSIKKLTPKKLSPKKSSIKKLTPKKSSIKKLTPKKLSPKKSSIKKLSPKKLSPKKKFY
jgi:hypothetical protein